MFEGMKRLISAVSKNNNKNTNIDTQEDWNNLSQIYMTMLYQGFTPASLKTLQEWRDARFEASSISTKEIAKRAHLHAIKYDGVNHNTVDFVQTAFESNRGTWAGEATSVQKELKFWYTLKNPEARKNSGTNSTKTHQGIPTKQSKNTTTQSNKKICHLCEELIMNDNELCMASQGDGPTMPWHISCTTKVRSVYIIKSCYHCGEEIDSDLELCIAQEGNGTFNNWHLNCVVKGKSIYFQTTDGITSDQVKDYMRNKTTSTRSIQIAIAAIRRTDWRKKSDWDKK